LWIVQELPLWDSIFLFERLPYVGLELEQISKLPFGGFLQVPLSLSLKPGKSAAPSPRYPATHHPVHLWLIFI